METRMSEYTTASRLDAKVVEREIAGGFEYVTRLYDSGWLVANLVFASIDEAEEAAHNWWVR